MTLDVCMLTLSLLYSLLRIFFFCQEKMENANQMIKVHVAVRVMKDSYTVTRSFSYTLTHTHHSCLEFYFTLQLVMFLSWLGPHCR